MKIVYVIKETLNLLSIFDSLVIKILIQYFNFAIYLIRTNLFKFFHSYITIIDIFSELN